MDFNKFSSKEVDYYCHSSKIDFDCLPHSTKIEMIVEIFNFYGVKNFTVKDIKLFLKKYEVTNWNDKKFNPSESKIIQTLKAMGDRLIERDGEFECKCIDSTIYENAIRSAYDEEIIK